MSNHTIQPKHKPTQILSPKSTKLKEFPQNDFHTFVSKNEKVIKGKIIIKNGRNIPKQK